MNRVLLCGLVLVGACVDYDAKLEACVDAGRCGPAQVADAGSVSDAGPPADRTDAGAPDASMGYVRAARVHGGIVSTAAALPPTPSATRLRFSGLEQLSRSCNLSGKTCVLGGITP